jgi:hypothetical protein
MSTPRKAFDAVAASRQWREVTSRKLDAMTREQRLAHYAQLWNQATAKKVSKRGAARTA